MPINISAMQACAMNRSANGSSEALDRLGRMTIRGIDGGERRLD